MTTINRNHKDTLFCRLFGTEDRKHDALQLYNALSGSNHKNPDELEISTIEDTVYLGRKNDVSYLVGQDMMLIEHQSTPNPNMPLRGLHYLSQLYSKLIVEHDLDLYGEKLLELPTPQYVVLYFGSHERPEREEMRLSDSFAAGPGDLEVTATVLNCTENMNRPIMEKCKTLADYSRFVAIEKEHRSAGLKGREAVEATVNRCIEEGVLAGYLRAHRAEVMDLLFTIEDEERAMRVHLEALEREAEKRGFERGEQRGEQRGEERGLEQGIKQGRESLAARLIELGVDEDILKQAMSES